MRNNFYEHNGKGRFGHGVAAFAVMAVLVLGICAGCTIEPNELGTKAPAANAGTNQTRTLANDLTVTLDGSEIPGPDGDIISYSWICVSYTEHADVKVPYTVDQVTGLIVNADNVTATVALRKAGIYVFRLTITDENGTYVVSDVTVTVNPYIEAVIVTASFPGISAGNTLDFTPVYGDGYENGDVTYTLEDSVTGALNGSVVGADAYTLGETITFTQIFYNKSEEKLARQVVKADVNSPARNQSFASLRDDNDIPLPAALKLDLFITKQVVEIP